MKQHRYRITVEHLTDAEGNPVSRDPPRFEVSNHDQILGIVDKLRSWNEMRLRPTDQAALRRVDRLCQSALGDQRLYGPVDPSITFSARRRSSSSTE